MIVKKWFNYTSVCMTVFLHPFPTSYIKAIGKEARKQSITRLFSTLRRDLNRGILLPSGTCMYSPEILQLGGHADKNHYERSPRGSFSQYLLFERKKSHSESLYTFLWRHQFSQSVHLQYCLFFASPFRSPFCISSYGLAVVSALNFASPCLLHQNASAPPCTEEHFTLSTLPPLIYSVHLVAASSYK